MDYDIVIQVKKGLSAKQTNEVLNNISLIVPHDNKEMLEHFKKLNTIFKQKYPYGIILREDPSYKSIDGDVHVINVSKFINLGAVVKLLLDYFAENNIRVNKE